MPRMHEKSRAYDLFACQKAGCNVMTFIKQLNCPHCGTPGAVLRLGDTFSRPQPSDPRDRSYTGGEG